MNLEIDNLVSLARSLGVAHSAIIAVEDIKFNEDFRKQCEQNTCGSYNKNWMCPPFVGSVNELKDRVLKFKKGLLFQNVYQLEDSYDYEGMQQGTENHTKVLRQILDNIRNTGVFKECLPLSIGPCTFCGRCSFLDGQECRFPEEAISSVEASGIDVTALVKSYGIPYNNGKDTVSYVGLILFNPE